MKEEIFLGSYYIRQSKSYLSDIIKNDACSIIDENVLNSISIEPTTSRKLIERLGSNKIVAMELTSRHKRSIKTGKELEESLKKYRMNYKVIIEYAKNVNSPDSIKSKMKIMKLLLK